MIATEENPTGYEVVQGPYTCNGSSSLCERDRFGGCQHCEAKELEKASAIATQLRRMADWLEAHPDAAAKLMTAEIQGHTRGRITLYKDAPLVKAFAGESARRLRRGDYRILTIERDGILFEGYGELIPRPEAEEEAVTL